MRCVQLIRFVNLVWNFLSCGPPSLSQAAGQILWLDCGCRQLHYTWWKSCYEYLCNIFNYFVCFSVCNLDFTADCVSNTFSIHIFPTDAVVTVGALGGGRGCLFLNFMCNDLLLLHLHHCTLIYFKSIPKSLSFRQWLSFNIQLFLLLLPCSSYFTVIFKLLLLTFSKEFRSCDSRFCVRNFWISLLFHFMHWHLMLQVYSNLFLFVQYTALDLVLCLVVQTSSFWWFQLGSLNFSQATPRQWQTQHLQWSGFYSETMDIIQNFSHDSRTICLTEWDTIYVSEICIFFFFTFSSIAKKFTICGILLCTAHNKK